MIAPQIIAIAGMFILGLWSLKRLHDNFSERLFFTIGMWLFIIQGVSGSYGLYLEWAFSPGWIIISKIASLSFNFLLAFFFYWMKSKAPASMGGPGTQLTPEEISKFLDDDKKNGK